VNIVEPGTMYGERLNQLDVRFAKILVLGGGRTSLNLDLYNAFNVSTVLTQNNTYGPSWLQPNGIFPARFAKVSWQFDF